MLKRLAQLWHGETNGLTTAAFIVGAASLASRLVGVLRDRTLAGTFGAGHALDAYYAAFRVPDFLYNLVILGALSAGFIPVFAEYLEKRERHEVWQLAEQVLSVVAATMAITCALLAFFAPLIVPLTVPGFPPDLMALTVRLSRIMFLSPFLLGLSAVMGGILQATRRMLAFALAPVLYNLGIIFGAIFLVPHMGVEGVAWGVILGALMHFAVQTSVVLRLGLRKLPRPSLRSPGVRRIMFLMAPRTAGLAVSQLNLVILLSIASTLAVGSVSIFNLANNLQSFPVGLFGISFAVAAFPLLAKYASLKDQEHFKKTLVSSMRKVTFLILPVTALFFLLRAQIVRLALGAGEFSWDDTIRTATVLGIFTVSLLGQALVPLFARAFYALQNTRTPFWVSFVSEAANICAALLLYHRFGVDGLAVAFSIATYVNLLLLWWQLRRQYGSLHEKEYFGSFGRTFIASIAVIAAGYPVRQFIGSVLPLRTFWQVALQAAAAGTVGACAFLLVAYLFRSPELAQLLAAVNRRLFRQPASIEGAEEAQGL